MSSALVRPLLACLLLAGAIFCGHAALANAASLEDMLATQLVPSAPPALLAPITSVGRKGWDCKPEHVAAARQWRDAELPANPDHP